ncbi:glucosamine-6-phosphate deaminase, partial [Bacillus sp. JJ1503]
KNYEEMSKEASKFIIEKVRKTPKMKLGFATGETPEGHGTSLIENNLSRLKDYLDFAADRIIILPGESEVE